MCVIIHLDAKENLSDDNWFNAINNNEHGFGMLVKIPRGGGKLDEIKLIKLFNESGNDVEEIKETVGKYQEYERWIHLRYKTVGSTTEDNVQPFLIREDGDRVAYFMHNGTLSAYRPTTTYVHGVQTPQDDRSDSQIFAETFLKPSLENVYSNTIGVGDYTCDFFRDTLDNNWNATKQGAAKNRGVIVSNYAPTLIINNNLWTTIYNDEPNDEGEYNEIAVSNDDYFDKLVRGSLHEKLKKEKEDKERKEREEKWKQNGQSSQTKGGSSIQKLIGFRPNNNLVDNPTIKITDIIDDVDIIDGDQIDWKAFATVSYNEWREAFADHEQHECALIVYNIAQQLYEAVDESESQSTKILTLLKKIAELEKKLESVSATVEEKV